MFENVPPQVRKRMSKIRKRNSKPELAVRRLAHSLGFRFRLNRADLPGTPDLVFPRLRKIIFVHGCFWHQHSGCKHANVPKARPQYWIPKLDRTKQRDEEALQALKALGWEVLILWECELRDPLELGQRLVNFLGAARAEAIPVD